MMNQDDDDLNSANASKARAANSFPTPPPIPHHTLIRRIGSGSYGEVWLARNTMGMYRAVKILYRSCFDDQRPFERELSGIRKFEPISRSHDGFIDVLQVGLDESDAYFFYIMELGDDGHTGQEIFPENYSPKTLASEIASRRRLQARDCLELGAALAKAIHQLHKNGLVHRDIKPSNIIFVMGIPKLADIGLVAGVDDTHSYVGTQGFIPPEGPGSPQGDVFSLGKVLYEASTGKDRHYFPELPDTLKVFPDPDLFLELNEIILRACKPDPKERYQSAEEMHGELVLLLNGKSVKRLRLLERKLSSFKRAGMALLGTLAIGAAVAFPFYQQHQEKVAARQRQIGATIAYGNRSMESGDLLASLPFYADALRLHKESKSDETADRIRLGSVLAQCPKLTHVWSEDSEIKRAEFSHDGTRVVVNFAQGQPKIHDLQSESNPSIAFGSSRYLVSASFSHNDRLVVTASDDGNVTLFDSSSLASTTNFVHADRVKSARFSPDDRKLLTACWDGKARIFDLESRALERSFPHGDKLLFADFSHDGRLVATAGEDGAARIWDAKSGQLLAELPHPNWVLHVSFSPDDSQVVTACADHNAWVWDITGRHKYEQRFPVLTHEDVVFNAEFSPDGRSLLTACLDGTAHLWSSKTLQPLEVNPILRCGERVSYAAFSSDGRRIIVTGVKGAVRIWDFASVAAVAACPPCVASRNGKCLMALSGHGVTIADAETGKLMGPEIIINRPIDKMKLNFDGRYAAIIQHSARPQRMILGVYEVSSAHQVGDEFQIEASPWMACLSDDGQRVALVTNKVINIMDTVSHQALPVQMRAECAVDSGFFNADGQRLVTWSSKTNVIQVWDIHAGRNFFAPLKMAGLIGRVQLSADENEIVGCCWDPQLTPCYSQVWSFKTGQMVSPRLMHDDGVLCACFSPDGLRVASAGEDSTARIWETLTWQQAISPVRHHNQVQSIEFNFNGSQFLTGSSDKTARVWSTETGDPLTPPLRQLAEIESAHFLAQGQRVLVGTKGGSKYIRDIEPDHRPIEDLFAMAKLLCGNAIEYSVRPSANNSAVPQEAWRALRGKYGPTFTVSESEIRRWHEFVAEESETNADWFSAAFHLKYLLEEGATNKAVLARLTSAERSLRREH